jgi:hypothetical protein
VTAVAAWVLLPLVVGVASLGCGLLLEIAAGTYLPGPLLIPAGFAVVVVASQFPPLSSQTAALAPPLIVGLAFAGFALGFPRRPSASSARTQRRWCCRGERRSRAT